MDNVAPSLFQIILITYKRGLTTPISGKTNFLQDSLVPWAEAASPSENDRKTHVQHSQSVLSQVGEWQERNREDY